MRLYGFFIGLLSTLMGVGGGLFANLLMTFYGRPIHQAVATSSALAVLISIPGAIGYVYAGWPAAARFPDVTALQLPFSIGYVSLIGALLSCRPACSPRRSACAPRMRCRSGTWRWRSAHISSSSAAGLWSVCCDRFAPHVELAVILVGDAEFEPFVVAFAGLIFTTPSVTGRPSCLDLCDQSIDDPGADAATLERGVDKDLLQVERVVLYRCLQPSRYPRHLT